MMKAASTSETSVNFYQTTRRNNPEDSHLNTGRRENLESHVEVMFVNFLYKLKLCADVAIDILYPLAFI
jgi:hypothetical protein